MSALLLAAVGGTWRKAGLLRMLVLEGVPDPDSRSTDHGHGRT